MMQQVKLWKSNLSISTIKTKAESSNAIGVYANGY